MSSTNAEKGNLMICGRIRVGLDFWGIANGVLVYFCRYTYHAPLAPRPRALASPLGRPRPTPRVDLPLDDVPRPGAAGRRDCRVGGSGVVNLEDLVVVGGFSTKDVSVVLKTS
jgi:hypothetical protein